MKHFSLYLVFALAAAGACAQPGLDCRWVLGLNTLSEVTDTSVVVLDFCSTPSPAQAHITTARMSFYAANACISDTNGQLLLYTNGIAVHNGQHQLLTNAISQGYAIDPILSTTGMPMPQGVLLLPFPGHPSRYVLLHEDFPDELASLLAASPLYYSVIDMSLNGGAGALAQNPTVLSADTLEYGKITATRHANGRDWWLVVPRLTDRSLLRYLLTPNGFSFVGATAPNMVPAGYGNAVFSPDGRYYANIAAEMSCALLAFDRCSGEFTTIEYFDVEAVPGRYVSLVCFSPNSRYLYISSIEVIEQLDMEAAPVSGSAAVVAQYDGFTMPWGSSGFRQRATFFHPQLAADGKIYLSAGGLLPFLHVIHQPDEQGAACQVEQRAVQTPVTPLGLPNLPNYRLGALASSPCDTLGATAVREPAARPLSELRIFPNPAQSHFTLSSDWPARYLRLYDGLGRQVWRQALPAGQSEHTLYLPEGLPAGIYTLVAEGEAGYIGRGRLAIQPR